MKNTIKKPIVALVLVALIALFSFYCNAYEESKVLDAVDYYNRGNAKVKLGKYEEAIKDYSHAIKLDPNHASAYFNRGNAKADLGKHEEAIEDYTEAIKLHPDFVSAYYNRGIAKDELGKHEEAIEDYTEAIKLHPDFL